LRYNTSKRIGRNETQRDSELAARRKQYEYYRDTLLTFEELV
jgi:hypothetical protein